MAASTGAKTDEIAVRSLAAAYLGLEPSDENLDLSDMDLTLPNARLDRPTPDELAPTSGTLGDLAAAEKGMRTLIDAYCSNPQQVDWWDVQVCLHYSLQAFGYPTDYPEQIYAKRQEEDESFSP